MIIVDTLSPRDDSDAASTKTLITFPKFPRFFPTLACSSLVISTAALVCAVLNGAQLFGHLNSLITILAFIFTLPYQVVAILLVWLHHHQTESILKWAPTSVRSITYSTLIVLFWAVSTVFTGWLLSTAIPRGRLVQCNEIECQEVGAQVVTPILTFTLSLLEALIMGTITTLCYLHGRSKPKEDTIELAPVPPVSKVISP